MTLPFSKLKHWRRSKDIPVFACGGIAVPQVEGYPVTCPKCKEAYKKMYPDKTDTEELFNQMFGGAL